MFVIFSSDLRVDPQLFQKMDQIHGRIKVLETSKKLSGSKLIVEGKYKKKTSRSSGLNK